MTIQSGYSAPLGSSDNIGWRVWTKIPRRWFAWIAPVRDAVIGGVADSAAWNYTLIAYAKAQQRLATAYGVWLDVFAFDFLGGTLTRNGLQDDAFRALIRATILQERVTRAGMVAAVTSLTGNTPWVFEPWNAGDTGGYSNAAQGQICTQFGYGVGKGGYGSMALPAQTFMTVYRGAPSGVPDVDGYGGVIGGYGSGAIEYVGGDTELSGITDDVIFQLINLTKPTGVVVWTRFDEVANKPIDIPARAITDSGNGNAVIMDSANGDIIIDRG